MIRQDYKSFGGTLTYCKDENSHFSSAMKHPGRLFRRTNFSVTQVKQLFLSLVIFSAFSCMGESKSAIKEPPIQEPQEVLEDTVNISEVKEVTPKIKISYSRDTLVNRKEVDSFKNRYSDAEEELIYALNRKDARRLRVGDELVIPDTLTMDLNDYSPFPEQLEIIKGIPKAVLISRRIQAVGLYENGKLKTWGPASTGKQSTPTPTGLYYGNYRSRKKISTIDKSWVMPFYFNYMNYEGIGTHEYTLPGYPASHGCVRLRKEEAVTIYEWADQWKLDDREQTVLQNGTPFMVFGEYNFKNSKPWLELAADQDANELTLAEKDIIQGFVQQYNKDERNFAPKTNPEELLAMPPEKGIETVQ
jgi:hypothetical protein